MNACVVLCLQFLLFLMREEKNKQTAYMLLYCAEFVLG